MENESKNIQQKQLKIKGMHCKSCADLIEKELKTVKGIKEIKVSYPKEMAFVQFNQEETSLDIIKKKIKELGYEADVKNNISENLQKEKMVRLKLGKPSFLTKLLGIVLILIFLITVVITKGFGLLRSNTLPEDNFLSIPLSDITSNASWYEYGFNKNKIRFFVVKVEDGTVKTAFDACDVCYRYKKGYRQEGSYMTCNNCGNRYPITGLGIENKNPGGCWPGYLPNIIQGDSVLIKKSDLENNRWRSL